MPYSSKPLIWEMYHAKKIAKNTHVGQSFSYRRTFEAFQLVPYLFFYNRLRWVTFWVTQHSMMSLKNFLFFFF